MVNRDCMNKFVGEHEYLTCDASIYNKKTQHVKIFKGMPIVAYRNIQKEHIFNSEVYTIESIDTNAKTFTFKVEDEVKTYQVDQFKNTFYPGFCITAHVSQGCTFNSKYTIWDWNHPRMDDTAKYVALSRATSIKNIQINI
jgi:ATP-dependent exoDNAse (exonuclease V) alpha subunit